MSSLTEKRKREIEEQIAKMKQQAERKVLLNVVCDIRNINDAPIITQRILKVSRLHGIESASFIYGTNTITVIAKWSESISQIVEKIKRMPWVSDVSGRILSPLF